MNDILSGPLTTLCFTLAIIFCMTLNWAISRPEPEATLFGA